MEEHDQRKQQHHIFESDRSLERQARGHQLRRDEVDEKRVGQPRAGELRMLRRKISTGRESSDDVDVQRQIVPVDEQPRVDAVGRLVHDGGKDHDKGSGEQHEQAEAPQRGAITAAERTRAPARAAADRSTYAAVRAVPRTNTARGAAARAVAISSAARRSRGAMRPRNR